MGLVCRDEGFSADQSRRTRVSRVGVENTIDSPNRKLETREMLETSSAPGARVCERELSSCAVMMGL